jgi:hypothetical protein
LAPVPGGAPSWSRSSASAVLLLGPFLGLSGPWFFGLALVLLLSSSPHRLRLGAQTKPSASHRCSYSASHRCSPSVPWCSARNLRPRSLPRPWCSSPAPRLRLGAPHKTFGLASVLLLGSSVFSLGSSVLRTKPAASQCSSSVLSSGKFLFCSTICHPFLILHFTHSTSTSLTHPADCYFSPLLFVSIFLDSLHSFFALFFASFAFTLFPFDYDSLRYKINLIKYPFLIKLNPLKILL